ncbi:MAG: hypothetical protein ACK52U_01180 [Synechococcaceae cyanobacterium]
MTLWPATAAGAADPRPGAEAPAWLRGARRRARPALSLSLAWNPQAFSSRHSLADWMT